ncbi:hypothetical protein GT037_001799 [Alternaria burnsii]|uniref:Uncharacterized protein n=1 Tax=Alternaria burnsii TaxID=1187904 RepID=A0A8H7EIL1_9PLEO|nr:uncharacterized protein GT037_001799 [Alternaria burnsii]KAF7680148.1 hypothetical protein GT037_001799 [Alternaria burnsii]
MPVIFDKMKLVPPEQALPDFSQISGFYGPGAWAAWVITMVASWIPVVQGDYTHNLHFIGYAIYTNWAAIDLMSQFNRVLGDNDDLSVVEQHSGSCWSISGL